MIPTTAFNALPTGARFVLNKTTPNPHGSTILEKIEPEPFLAKSGQPIEGLFWTARWCDGPHEGKLCVVVTGAEKAPYEVIALP